MSFLTVPIWLIWHGTECYCFQLNYFVILWIEVVLKTVLYWNQTISEFLFNNVMIGQCQLWESFNVSYFWFLFWNNRSRNRFIRFFLPNILNLHQHSNASSNLAYNLSIFEEHISCFSCFTWFRHDFSPGISGQISR